MHICFYVLSLLQWFHRIQHQFAVFDCVYDVLKQMANVVQHTLIAKVIVGFHFVGFDSSFSSLSAPASMG